MSISLQNKVIMVVGGTTGLGLSAARAFVGAGGKVLVLGRDAGNVATAKDLLGADSLALSADATKPGEVERCIAEAAKHFGSVHGLYHVAGGSGRKRGDGPLHELTDEGWEFTLNLNLTSIFYSNRAMVRYFMEQKTGGSILNIGSVLGTFPSPHFFATQAYAAAKAAVIGLTRSSASYYAPHNIRFNVLAPALVETPMSRRAMENAEIMDFIETKQPLDGGRPGQPQDLDAAALFFMSDASKFVTGQVLTIDGGWSVTEGQYPVKPTSP